MKAKKKSKLWIWQNEKERKGNCESCGEPHNKLTVDHIIPVSIVQMLDRSGQMCAEWEENFEHLCPICNGFKSNRIDIRNPKTKQLLQTLIDQI